MVIVSSSSNKSIPNLKFLDHVSTSHRTNQSPARGGSAAVEEEATGCVGGGRRPLVGLESEEDGPELATKQGAAGSPTN